MLSWTKRVVQRVRTPGRVVTTTTVTTWHAQTIYGTAIVTDITGEPITLDMWNPASQASIGHGTFPSVDAAKDRADAILDPRSTAWDMLDDILFDDEPAAIG
jgi:hypothetical protein